jgi:hypothetical protein
MDQIAGEANRQLNEELGLEQRQVCRALNDD